ncbi:hypothetical protein EUTSA_v10009646mg [Eutrema salsugineum]|uniref:F-box domain-containing protein n=1 Tax=Eutrema salsugineum TaxID=72664 RepID=V4K7I8_EUTSA|nr:hypothetical protein EUTSA_v10009646mg [Eutrema salsugineum]
MNYIPIDLIIQISSRLPAKSIARFRCVSKLWSSTFHRSYFTELFLTRSSAHPRLLFALKRDVPIDRNSEWLFFSSTQPPNPYGKASLLAASYSHLKCPEDTWLDFCGYVSGLICFTHDVWIAKGDERRVHVICNPSTGQYASLPSLKIYRNSRSYLGFDPIDKQFKVLSVADDGHKILTLGIGEMSWRKIQCCPLSLSRCFSQGICINGVLYYFAQFDGTYRIVCFDIKSENYKLIDVELFYFEGKLINYKGELSVILWKYGDNGTMELYMLILEDTEKQRTSKYVYTLEDDKYFDRYNEVSVAGVTATGAIVFSVRRMRRIRKPFRVFYFNPEKDTLQSIKIKGFGAEFYAWNNEIYTFVDHVKQLATST